MRGVNDKNFFNFWQILYRATCPGFEATRWRVGDVDWRKDHHTFAGSDYSVTLDVHCLTKSSTKGGAWQLLVTLEYWWDRDREVLKTQNWARVLDGNPKSILAWLHAQTRDRQGVEAISTPRVEAAVSSE